MTQPALPSLRKVIVTGISGCGYKERLQTLQQEGHVVWLDMGDTIMDIAAEYGLGYHDATILDAPKKELALLRALASERIMARVRELKSGNCVVVSLHATFKWKGVVVPGFDFHFLQTFGADAYINYIDDVDKLKGSLDSNPKWRSQTFELDDVLDWREAEYFLTQSFASYFRKPFYVIAAQEPQCVLLDVVLGSSKPKAYFSYSITHSDAEQMGQARDAIERLRSFMTVFDPYAIKENRLTEQITDEKVRRRIRCQVVQRDYHLIDQSDLVLVFFPGKQFSQGVASEIIYGYSNSKKVYMTWPHAEQSPFLDYYTHKVFRDLDSMIDFLRAEYARSA